MKAKAVPSAAILRVASLLALLQYGAHGFLFISVSLAQGPGKLGTIAASRSHSYWDVYFGYGLLAILSGLVEVALLWQLSVLARAHAERIRPIVVVFVLGNFAHAVLIWRYFRSLPRSVLTSQSQPYSLMRF